MIILAAGSVLSGDVTRDDSQRRFLPQHSAAMLKQCCNHSKQCRNNVATLCCAKNRRCESSRVTSPLGTSSYHYSREGNWAEVAFAENSGTVTRDREKISQ